MADTLSVDSGNNFDIRDFRPNNSKTREVQEEDSTSTKDRSDVATLAPGQAGTNNKYGLDTSLPGTVTNNSRQQNGFAGSLGTSSADSFANWGAVGAQRKEMLLADASPMNPAKLAEPNPAEAVKANPQAYLNVNNASVRDKLEVTGLMDSKTFNQIDNKDTAFVLNGNVLAYRNINSETKEVTEGQVDLSKYNGQTNFGAKGWDKISEENKKSLDQAYQTKQEALKAFGGDNDKFKASQEIDSLLARSDINAEERNSLNNLKTALAKEGSDTAKTKEEIQALKENNPTLYKAMVQERKDALLDLQTKQGLSAFNLGEVPTESKKLAEFEQNLDKQIDDRTAKDHELSIEEKARFDKQDKELAGLVAKDIFQYGKSSEMDNALDAHRQYDEAKNKNQGSEYLLELQGSLKQKFDSLSPPEVAPQQQPPLDERPPSSPDPHAGHNHGPGGHSH